MSFAIDVYYGIPQDDQREERIARHIKRYGGVLSYRDLPRSTDSNAICLTFEFQNQEDANRAAGAIREQGEHVEGAYDYGEENDSGA